MGGALAGSSLLPRVAAGAAAQPAPEAKADHTIEIGVNPVGIAPGQFHLERGKRYRIHTRNASDDIHPVHPHQPLRTRSAGI